MTLSDTQAKAVDIIHDNFNRQIPVTVVAGYAGTGKSTIIEYFVKEMDLLEQTKLATYTGKAALVLRKKGLPATTIHKLIYNTYKDRSGKYHFKLKTELDDPDTALIVIDEVSMVSKDLLKDLLTFHVPIVALGDPGQLPPVNGYVNNLLEHPDVFLDEIHRQAAENSIIRIAQLAREGRTLPIIQNDANVKILTRKDFDLSMCDWADQVLCAKNITRRNLNEQMRLLKDRTGNMPQQGDKLICLRNYWDTCNADGYPLVNGTIGTVADLRGKIDLTYGSTTALDFIPDYDDNGFNDLIIDTNIFFNQPTFSSTNPRSKKTYYEFDYGYAITCHKAQGSEFDKVLVYEEHLKGDDHNKWLYTAITRASDKLVIIKERY